MTKDFILSEIRRATQQNGGIPPGRAKFSKITGIKQTEWYGKFWSRWGDALKEAGYAANELQLPYDEPRIVESLAGLVRELGRFPVEAELRIKARADKNFPSHSVFGKLGPRSERAQKVLNWSKARLGFDDVAAICRPITSKAVAPRQESEPHGETSLGFVYLARMGKHYKIGRTATRAARI